MDAAASRHRRLALLFVGAVTLAWLALEDPSPWPPLTLGAAFAGLLALHFVHRRVNGRAATAGRFLLLCSGSGLVAGAYACLLAVGLMLFKNARHAHSIPDHPAAQVLAILQLAPQMALCGLLAGALPACAILLLRPK